MVLGSLNKQYKTLINTIILKPSVQEQQEVWQ